MSDEPPIENLALDRSEASYRLLAQRASGLQGEDLVFLTPDGITDLFADSVLHDIKICCRCGKWYDFDSHAIKLRYLACQPLLISHVGCEENLYIPPPDQPQQITAQQAQEIVAQGEWV